MNAAASARPGHPPADDGFVLDTERLVLRRLSDADAGFILELLNEPDFIRFIGDRGIRTMDDARAYIADGPVASYLQNGYGLYRVELKESGEPIGICGLLNRDELEDVDIGFAFLGAFRSSGYGTEAAAAVKDHARDVLGLTRLAAITQRDNPASIRVLEKIGLRYEIMVRLRDDEPPLLLYACDL